jgi:N-acetylmuramoyl-L-alanine amidase
MTKKLMLDAGHGLNTSGKRTPDGIREFTLNRNVVNFIVEYLKDYNVTIQLSHDITGKVDVTLAERVRRCNAFAPDLFISIHHNAHLGTWGTATGTEVFTHTQGTAADRTVASLIAPRLASETGLRNRGTKTMALGVLNCKATAVLCEGGFMDNRTDHAIITRESGQKAYAKAVAESVISYLKLTKKAVPTPPTVPSNGMYTVKSGDTLWGIATANKVSVNDLRAWNNLKTDLLQIGQRLVVNGNNHVVVVGQTLWGISQIYNTTVDNIIALNNLNSIVLQPGQVLRIK